MTISGAYFSSRACYMDAGPLQPFVRGFVGSLRARQHTPLTIAGYENSARHFAGWLCHSGIELSRVDEDVVQRFARHRCHCPGGRRQDRVSVKYVRRVRRFIEFLVECGVLTAITPPVLDKIDVRIAAFQDTLRRHRGISERTIDRHGRMIMRLLARLGADPEAYDAALVRHVILDEAKSSSRLHVKTMATALRGYLRFLAASGLCRYGLDHAVPTIPAWRLSALPRYLRPGDVQRVIESCDLTKPHGIRDRAILLLLARLGLRAGDILCMRLDDIAWNEGTLRVRGKGRREIRLPLPQDAGDALIDYLSRARPLGDEDRVFLRSSAPYRPFKDSSVVSSVVRLALERAGIAEPPSRGANLLRHSAATGMLRAGASLDSIATVLRHRSLDITAHYAKVDVAMLQQVAQPWPGDVTC
jgi:site-specific recombinase XerD